MQLIKSTICMLFIFNFTAHAQMKSQLTHESGIEITHLPIDTNTTHRTYNNKFINKTAEKQTVALIKNKTQREKIIENDKEARKSDDFVKQVMGKNSDEAYEAAADFMPYLIQIGNGDPNKMTEILNKAARDPAAFAESLPEDLKNKIRALSLKAQVQSESQKP